MIYSRPTALTADRSLPRKSIVMIIHPDEMARVPEPALPDGYAFRTYLPGDEKNWARITTIVDEFSCEQNAENAFRKQFMQDEDALRKRLSFVIAPDGNAIATSMAWNFDENDRHFGRVHWICTDPAHQGKGIGRAIVAWAIRRIARAGSRRGYLSRHADLESQGNRAVFANGISPRARIAPDFNACQRVFRRGGSAQGCAAG